VTVVRHLKLLTDQEKKHDTLYEDITPTGTRYGTEMLQYLHKDKCGKKFTLLLYLPDNHQLSLSPVNYHAV